MAAHFSAELGEFVRGFGHRDDSSVSNADDGACTLCDSGAHRVVIRVNEPGLPLQPYRSKLASVRRESHGVSWTVRGGDAVVTLGTSRRQVIVALLVILMAAAATLVMALRGKPGFVLTFVLLVVLILLRYKRRNRLTLRVEDGILRTTTFPASRRLRVNEMLSVLVYRNPDGTCELLATAKDGSEHVLLDGVSQKQARVVADFLTQFLELGKPALPE